jgi:uncharacterized cupredoxin-like copper-binding protein
MLLNKTVLALSLSLLFASHSVIAGGSHGGGHDDDKAQQSSSTHGNANNHGHSNDTHGNDMHSGGHGHGDGGHAESAVGKPGKPGDVTRTVNVELLDSMRFDFLPQLSITEGEVIRFIVQNTGSIRHEFSIGNSAEQEAHREMMRNMPNMVHEDGNSVTVEPGETKELIWSFGGDKHVEFACNIPGHSEAGMKAMATVGS